MSTCPPCHYPAVCSPGRCRMEEDPKRFPDFGPNYETHGYHWRQGMYFRRTANGDVEITQTQGVGSQGYVEWKRVVPASEWASIIASVSKQGETGENYQAALDYHGRPATTELR